MKTINNIEKISELESELAGLRSEFEALKKLVFKIADAEAEKTEAAIKEFWARREAVGE